MPILARSPDQFPANLLDTLDQRQGASWSVLLVRSRQEKATAEELLHLEVAFYLPMTTNSVDRPGRRSTTSYLPLFPGYVFVHADEEDRVRAVRSRRVCNCLPVPDQEGLTRNLRSIYLLLAAGLHAKSAAEVGGTKSGGTWASFREGNLRGARVQVAGIGSREDLIVVMITILGQVVSFEVPGCNLSPL